MMELQVHSFNISCMGINTLLMTFSWTFVVLIFNCNYTSSD
uniref:Uncharacterized protein n=1 Tax=Rhizophora mucronata TaxID=61149 RepID=A0A2P2QVP3_RHIMU